MPDVASQFREFIRLDRKQRGEGLSAKEFECWTRLKRALGRRFSPSLSEECADQRASVRVPTRLRVDFATLDELRGQLMTNLSRGGVFVSSHHLLEIGTRVTLRLHIETSGELLEVPAEVVSTNVGPNFETEPRGMGMRFLDMDPDVKRRIESLYDGFLRDAVQRSEGD